MKPKLEQPIIVKDLIPYPADQIDRAALSRVTDSLPVFDTYINRGVHHTPKPLNFNN